MSITGLEMLLFVFSDKNVESVLGTHSIGITKMQACMEITMHDENSFLLNGNVPPT